MANITINFVAGLQGPQGAAGIPDLAALPQYKDDDEAKANGLGINDSYVVATGSDVLVPGTVKLIVE